MPAAGRFFLTLRAGPAGTGQRGAMGPAADMPTRGPAIVARQVIIVGPIVARPVFQLRAGIDADRGIVRRIKLRAWPSGTKRPVMAGVMRSRWLVGAGGGHARHSGQCHEAGEYERANGPTDRWAITGNGVVIMHDGIQRPASRRLETLPSIRFVTIVIITRMAFFAFASCAPAGQRLPPARRACRRKKPGHTAPERAIDTT